MNTIYNLLTQAQTLGIPGVSTSSRKFTKKNKVELENLVNTWKNMSELQRKLHRMPLRELKKLATKLDMYGVGKYTWR